MKSKKKKATKKHVWIVGTALALAAIAIFLVTFYSGSLSLAAFHGTGTVTNITTKLDCSVSQKMIQVQVSTPGMTVFASQLNNLRINWSNNENVGRVRPSASSTNRAGIAETMYSQTSNSQASDTVRADFSGERFSNHGVRYYYLPSSCQVAIPASGVTNPSPTPSTTPGSFVCPSPRIGIDPIYVCGSDGKTYLSTTLCTRMQHDSTVHIVNVGRCIAPSTTPQPTVCPMICRKVGNAWKCGC